MHELQKKIENDLNKENISGKILLGKLKFIEEASRHTSAYSDPRYAPFYYYLGKYIKPKNVVEIGFGLGIFSSCFFMSCRSTEYFLGFQEKTEGFNRKLGRDNIKNNYSGEFDIHVGSVIEDGFLEKFSPNSWDLSIFNIETTYDQHKFYLDLVWDRMNLDGYLVMDYIFHHEPAKRAFADFAFGKNRTPIVFNTRYGTGILKK